MGLPWKALARKLRAESVLLNGQSIYTAFRQRDGHMRRAVDAYTAALAAQRKAEGERDRAAAETWRAAALGVRWASLDWTDGDPRHRIAEVFEKKAAALAAPPSHAREGTVAVCPKCATERGYRARGCATAAKGEAERPCLHCGAMTMGRAPAATARAAAPTPTPEREPADTLGEAQGTVCERCQGRVWFWVRLDVEHADCKACHGTGRGPASDGGVS